MNKNIDRSSILQMARGAFQERVDYEMGRVVDNILDLNTKATERPTQNQKDQGTAAQVHGPAQGHRQPARAPRPHGGHDRQPVRA